jgi:hypothetical protein
VVGALLISSAIVAADRVSVALFYETKCPYCQNFITTSLSNAMNSIPQAIDLQLVPYGNAKENVTAAGILVSMALKSVLEIFGQGV